MKGDPITIEEARRLLAAHVPAPQATSLPLRDSLGSYLSTDISSDVDMPPFDRAMMDGFAVIAADTSGEMDVIEDIPAGKVGLKTVKSGQCSRIMTGAPVPGGADAVQQVEKTEAKGPRVRILQPVKPGQNVAPRASEMKTGDIVLKAGTRIRPAEMSVLATVGRASVPVYRRPRCAMIVTGDELVEPDQEPGPGQIRNSNGFGVPAQVRQLGLECGMLGRAADDIEALRPMIRKGLESDVLILSGGVSAGRWDLVIPALEAEGVKHEFHQVLIRPGRPFFFGTRGRSVIFGLPGNPVSSFVTFEVFVRPFLGMMMGNPSMERPRMQAVLALPLEKSSGRVHMVPAVLEGPEVRPLPWKGSADIVTLSRANALIIQPRETPLAAGDRVDILWLD